MREGALLLPNEPDSLVRDSEFGRAARLRRTFESLSFISGHFLLGASMRKRWWRDSVTETQIDRQTDRERGGGRKKMRRKKKKTCAHYRYSFLFSPPSFFNPTDEVWTGRSMLSQTAISAHHMRLACPPSRGERENERERGQDRGLKYSPGLRERQMK